MSTLARPLAPSPRRGPALALGVVGVGLLVAVALGHDGRRIAQLLALAAPVVLWLAWPVRSPAWHRMRAMVVWAWSMLFVADAVVRAYLLEAYQAAPDGALVLGAAANTTSREGSEYLSMHWRAMAVWSAPMVACAFIFWRQSTRGARLTAAWPRWTVGLLCAALLVSAVAYASKPWRRLHPVAFWTTWAESARALRMGWADQQQARDAALARARAAGAVVARHGPSTVVLVITDSINRDNMALYGYGRATTPHLLAHQQQLGDDMLVLRNAWSVDASTLPALGNLFGFAAPSSAQPQHLLALARAAGYKVWWMSNHDDVAVEQQHARFADVVEMVNRTPGRSSTSLDGELLDCVQEALEDPSERKLIVVHLMGAHPHYGLRFPAGDNPFDDQADAVEAGLIQSGRSAWVRRFRQDYDAAVLYQDQVVGRTLELARTIHPKGASADAYRAWMYLSDHGQEVGHGSDRVGHSPTTASGYRIPAIIWRNQRPATAIAALGERPFRADWAGWTIADLLQIRWAGESGGRNVLDPAYAWQAPAGSWHAPASPRTGDALAP